jgi:hypothetical protein
MAGDRWRSEAARELADPFPTTILAELPPSPVVEVPRCIAHARSGDKGDTATSASRKKRRLLRVDPENVAPSE